MSGVMWVLLGFTYVSMDALLASRKECTPIPFKKNIKTFLTWLRMPTNLLSLYEEQNNAFQGDLKGIYFRD